MVSPEGRTRGSRKDRAHTRTSGRTLCRRAPCGRIRGHEGLAINEPAAEYSSAEWRPGDSRALHLRLLNGGWTGSDGEPADGINSSETMRARSAGYITNAREMAQPRLPARHARYHENCPLYVVCISIHTPCMYVCARVCVTALVIKVGATSALFEWNIFAAGRDRGEAKRQKRR